MSRHETISFRRRHLPHWFVVDRHYFVTIRLKGSLPKSALEKLIRERAKFLSSCPTEEALNDFQRQHLLKIEAILDSARSGPKYLLRPAIAQIVMDAFAWLEDEKHWVISAATVMPNHVHVLFRNKEGHNDRLNADLGILKGFTAYRANRMLSRKGHFWMDENFDHWCRSPEQFLKAHDYIMDNPVKAGLVSQWSDWPWSKSAIPG